MIDMDRYRRICDRTTPEDAAAIADDWRVVGDDLRAAMPDESAFRQCKDCGLHGHEGARFRKNNRGYFFGVCKACESKRQSARVKNDPDLRERVLAYKREWNIAHPEQPKRKGSGTGRRRPLTRKPSQPKAIVTAPPTERWVPTLRERLREKRRSEQ